MSANSDPKVLLRQEIRQATRGRFHQTMGELRSMAARMAASGHTDDEEGYFRGLVAEYFLVEAQELGKLLGVEVAASMMDPFTRKRDGDTAGT